MIGLTQNSKPKPRLQSFYLAFNERLFGSPLFASIMTNLLNLPSKDAVIDVYEAQLTGYFQEHGFQWEVLFPDMAQDGHSDDAFFRWLNQSSLAFPARAKGME